MYKDIKNVMRECLIKKITEFQNNYQTVIFPSIVYVVKEDAVIDGDDSCSGVIGIYSTLGNARIALKNRAKRAHAEEEKEWYKNGKKYGTIQAWVKTDEKYDIWKSNDYSNNHINITIEETKLNPSFYLK